MHALDGKSVRSNRAAYRLLQNKMPSRFIETILASWLLDSGSFQLHHRSESADDFGQASGDLAEGTMFDAVDEFGESVPAFLNDGSEPV